jgi:sulfofructose kinase
VVVFSAPGLEVATGVRGIAEGLRAASSIGSGVMMATDGAKGVYWLDGGKLRHQPAHEVEAVDTLGAGDVFHGALALALAEGRHMEAAVRFANAAAAIKVTRFGGRAGTPNRSEVNQLL